MPAQYRNAEIGNVNRPRSPQLLKHPLPSTLDVMAILDSVMRACPRPPALELVLETKGHPREDEHGGTGKSRNITAGNVVQVTKQIYGELSVFVKTPKAYHAILKCKITLDGRSFAFHRPIHSTACYSLTSSAMTRPKTGRLSPLTPSRLASRFSCVFRYSSAVSEQHRRRFYMCTSLTARSRGV